MGKSKQRLAERVLQAISASTTMVELWERLEELAVGCGQPADILNGWLDGFLEKVSSEYGLEEEHWDSDTMRDLALDPGEPVSEVAMELLLEERQEFVREIVAILHGPQGNNASSMSTLKIKKLHTDARVPQRATEGATGLDLFAYIKEEGGRVILDQKPKLVGTGIAIEVPKAYDVQIRPRSGLSSKGIMVALGTVDSDYRGEVMVTMYTLGPNSSFEIKHGDRIAQLVIGKVADLPVEEAEELSSTERGPKGHGSTGIA